MVRLNDVSFSYDGQEENGLHHVSAEIPDGQCVLLCGESGCGKLPLSRCSAKYKICPAAACKNTPKMPHIATPPALLYAGRGGFYAVSSSAAVQVLPCTVRRNVWVESSWVVYTVWLSP